jgi:hypothetical protein
MSLFTTGHLKEDLSPPSRKPFGDISHRDEHLRQQHGKPYVAGL